MTATLPRPLAVSNGGAKETPRWGNGRQDPVAAALAMKWGMQPKSVEHLLSGPQSIFRRAAEAIAEFRQQGATLRLDRATRELCAALEQREAPPLVPATWNMAQEADCAEDVAELAYQQDPSAANLDRLIRAKSREIMKEHALLDALVAKQKAGA